MKISSIRFYILTAFILSSIYAQLDYGINYELKYFDSQDEDGGKVNVFENYFDINIYSDDWYFYSLLRYKNPPLIGSPTNEFKDIYNIFFLEYSNDKLQFQLGDIFQSYGAGLSMHTYEDRTIDYNNAPRGASILYYLKDNIDVFGFIGSNTFSSRTNIANPEPNIFVDNSVASMGISYQNNYFDMHYLTMLNNQKIDSESIVNMMSFNNILGDYLNHHYPSGSDGPSDFSMNVLEHNLGGTLYIKDLELYIERSWVYHNKIEGERTLGYKTYLSSYFSLNDYGILYEYKNYNTPYYYSVLSNPPIVFKENSSTLISRNLHNVDFSNEIGHHILINKSYSEQLNILLSSACAYNPLIDGSLFEPDFGQVCLDMLLQSGNMEEYELLNPYRQLYFEINGWTKDENLFYKIGIDKYLEYGPDKTINARTIPTQFTLKLKEGNSLSLYLEHQMKQIQSVSLASETKYYVHLSPSYNHYGKWMFSLFGDFEMDDRLLGIDDIKDGYIGADITYYINDSNLLSVFLGSQKGGLVCANGTCVMQPDFEKGFKITSKIMF